MVYFIKISKLKLMNQQRLVMTLGHQRGFLRTASLMAVIAPYGRFLRITQRSCPLCWKPWCKTTLSRGKRLISIGSILTQSYHNILMHSARHLYRDTLIRSVSVVLLAALDYSNQLVWSNSAMRWNLYPLFLCIFFCRFWRYRKPSDRSFGFPSLPDVFCRHALGSYVLPSRACRKCQL